MLPNDYTKCAFCHLIFIHSVLFGIHCDMCILSLMYPVASKMPLSPVEQVGHIYME